MGIFNHYLKEGAGVSKDQAVETSPVKRFFQVFAHRFWQLIFLNLLYLLACVPVVTIGPATAAMNYVCRNFSQRKPVDFFSDFVLKCKEHFRQGIAVWGVQTVSVVLLVFAIQLWSDPTLGAFMPSALRTVALVVLFLFGYLVLCAGFYIYPMMVSFDLSLWQLFKNSMIFSMYKIGQNLAMALFSVVIYGLCIFFWPASFPVLLFLAFTLVAFFNNFWVYPLLEKYIALPEDTKEAEEESVFEDNL